MLRIWRSLKSLNGTSSTIFSSLDWNRPHPVFLFIIYYGNRLRSTNVQSYIGLRKSIIIIFFYITTCRCMWEVFYFSLNLSRISMEGILLVISLKLNVDRCNLLHAWAFTFSNFPSNLISIGTTIPEKNACKRQADIEQCLIRFCSLLLSLQTVAFNTTRFFW